MAELLGPCVKSTSTRAPPPKPEAVQFSKVTVLSASREKLPPAVLELDDSVADDKASLDEQSSAFSVLHSVSAANEAGVRGNHSHLSVHFDTGSFQLLLLHDLYLTFQGNCNLVLTGENLTRQDQLPWKVSVSLRVTCSPGFPCQVLVLKMRAVSMTWLPLCRSPSQ